MKFRDFIKLNEATNARNYIVDKSADGHYNITGPFENPYVPHKWGVQIVNGQLILPPELESAREEIITAYFNRPKFAALHANPASSSSNNGSTPGSINVNADSMAGNNNNPPRGNTFTFPPTAPKQRV